LVTAVRKEHNRQLRGPPWRHITCKRSLRLADHSCSPNKPLFTRVPVTCSCYCDQNWEFVLYHLLFPCHNTSQPQFTLVPRKRLRLSLSGSTPEENPWRRLGSTETFPTYNHHIL